MAIVKMKKLRLYAVRSQEEELLSELMRLGCVEVTEPVAEECDAVEYTACNLGSAEPFRAQYASLTHALELFGQYAHVKSKLFAPRPVMSEDKFLDESGLDSALELAENIAHKDSRIRHISAEETRLGSLIESLKPWKELALPLDTPGTKYAAVVLGTVPASVILRDMDEALELAVPEAQVFQVNSDKEQHYLTLFCLREKLGEAMDALRPFSFSQSSLKTLSGTAQENIQETEQTLKELNLEKQSLISAIKVESSHREELRRYADLLSTKISRAETAERMIGSEHSVMLTGWVTAPQEEELSNVLSKFDCAWELEDPTPEETESVPVCLKNNKLTEPLMMVTEMYSLPSYDGIDPNPLIMPFFSIFFGIMYADLGYGIVLLLLGIFGAKLLKPKGMMKHMTGLLRLCGVTTMIFGILFGSFFGDAIPVFTTNILGRANPTELWSLIDPLKEPMVMLVGSLVVGVIHILIGMGINAYMLIRDGKPLDALFDVGSWWLLFAGIALGALGVTWWVCIAGVLALVLTQGRAKPTIIGKLIGGISSLYDIINYLGDILSYTRLMALLLAGSVIGSVVNTLGSLSGSLIVFIIVFLIGHVFNMGINIIGTYVHAARLQYLEFFGKFYKDGGRPFAPLKVNTKYVDVIKEEN